jgi:hypothetical protein
VLDSGVDLHHEDFACPGKLEVVADSDPITGDGEPEDQFGHGTHVAGIIGACTNNGKGIAGTAPDVTILPIRVLNESGRGNDQQLIKGIDRAVSAGAHVINMSLSFGPASVTPVFNPGQIGPAIERAVAAGVVVVASAGNDSLPICEYPGLAQDVICVGATDNRDAKAWYSLFTNKQTGPAVVAPGGQSTPFCDVDSEEILSTYAREVDEANEDCDGRLGYTNMSGTSMAAPHVAGIAAMVWDRLGGARTTENAALVRDAIVSTAVDLGPPGYDPVFGSGRVDALEAVRAVEVVPDPEPTPTPTEMTDLEFTGRSATSGQQGEKTLFEARLSDSTGEPIADAELTFELTGSESSRSFTATTDENGVGSATPTLEESPGPYQLAVRYAGDDTYEGSEDTTAFVVNPPSGLGDRQCTSGNPIVGQTVENVVVPKGERCTIMGSTVNGNIKALEDSTLDASANTIKGNVEADKAEKLTLADNDIGGNVTLKEGETPDGDDVDIDGNVLSKGNLKVEKVSGDISITDNTVAKGDLEVIDNTIGDDYGLVVDGNTVAKASLKVLKNKGQGDKSVTNNDGGDVLECKDNDDPFTGGPNGTWKEKKDQCGGDAPGDAQSASLSRFM